MNFFGPINPRKNNRPILVHDTVENSWDASVLIVSNKNRAVDI